MSSSITRFFENKQKEKLQGNQLKFPVGLTETGNDKFLMFQIFKTSKIFSGSSQQLANGKGGTNDTVSKKENIIKTIVLPIPANLTDAYNYDYSGEPLGGLVGVALEALARNSTGAGLLKDVAGGAAGAQFASVFALNAINALGQAANAPGLANAYVGAANPYLKNNFRGVGFKRHAFEYFMAARNAEDSIQIKKIVDAFRLYSAPFGAQDPILDTQYIFSISFSENVRPFLYKFQDCFLTDVVVSYNTSGSSAFHTEGAPVDVTLKLDFTENRIADGTWIEENYQDMDNFDTSQSTIFSF